MDDLIISRSHDGIAAGSTSTREFANGREMLCDFTRAGLGRGQHWSFIDGDTFTTVVDICSSRPVHAETETCDDVLLVRSSVGSACSYGMQDGAAWRFVRPAITVSYLPRGTRMSVVIEPDAPQLAVTVVVRASAILGRYGLRRADLPQRLLDVLDGAQKEAATLLSLPLGQDAASLVHDLVRSRLTGSLRGLQAAARGAELFALVTSAWKTREEGVERPGMRGRDAELVAAASRILNQRLVDPPTLQELAQELGTNRNKLNQLFQRSMGVTLKVYCVQKRIERARALLQEGRLNIAQISETVGYQHQSSFTAAFRDVVGMCPRDYGNTRQACAALEKAVH